MKKQSDPLVTNSLAAPDDLGKVTADYVRAAYAVLLDRAPESEDTVTRALRYRSRSAFRSAIFNSDEYKRRNPQNVHLNVLPINVPALMVQTALPRALRHKLFEHIQSKWTKLGEERAHWSVLSSVLYENGMTAELEEKFYASGQVEWQTIAAMMLRVGRAPKDFHRAAEFGCGLGRVTMQLADAFPKVLAIDISSSHLAQARGAALRLEKTNIDFRLGDLTSFGMREPFDFWYSRIVLQHNPPPLIRAILSQMLSLLAPGGLAIFQVPTYAVRYQFDTKDYLASRAGASDVEMHCLPQGVILDLITEEGCKLREVREDNSVDIPQYWVSNFFIVERPAKASRSKENKA